MSSLIYPTLPGLTLEQVRKYEWKTLVSEADSGVMTTIVRRKYPIIHWEHTYEVLRRYTASDELQSIVGLYNAVQGQFDTFLFTDPEFNTITLANMAQYGTFGIGNGSQNFYQLTATFENSGGPGGAEAIQNLNGTPAIYVSRFGLNELMSQPTRTNYLLESQTFNTTWATFHATVSLPDSYTDPAGTLTADGFVEDTTTNNHGVQQTVTVPSASETFTFTVYINPALTRTWALLQIVENTGSTNSSAFFNLAGAGAIGTIGAGANWSSVSATITPCFSGFYRCTLTATKTNAATSITAGVFAATANNTFSYTGNASDGLVVWGAQLEIGTLGSTMYLPTTTSTVTQSDYSINATGGVTFNGTPPAVGVGLLWTGSWYYRCRFQEDAIVWTKFMNQLWKAQVKFRQVKL